MEIKVLKPNFSICKVSDLSGFDLTEEYYFIGKTDEELSLVCSSSAVPKEALTCESGFRAFRIQGILDFSIVGILAKLTTLLAENGIGLFAVSTYNTDYVLTRAEHFQKALDILQRNGYTLAE